jgi:hypothetical protein
MNRQADDWAITRGVKNTVEGLGSAAHIGGYMASQVPGAAGNLVGSALTTASDPKAAMQGFVSEREDTRKRMTQTFKDGGGSDLASSVGAGVISYVPGLKGMAEGAGNVSLTEPSQTLARQQDPDWVGNVAQFAGGTGEFAGTAAAVAAPVSAGVKRMQRAPGKTASARPRATGARPKAAGAARHWEADDFLGGKMDDLSAARARKELQSELDGMGLSPAELQRRGLDDGITSFNNMPEEWLPDYIEIQRGTKSGGGDTRRFNEGMADAWGTRKSTGTEHAADAAVHMTEKYKAQMAQGKKPTGKQHWSQYGETPAEAVHSLRRLSKIYRLMDLKGPRGNPAARARAQVFDTLAEWAEESNGLGRN